jgi:hypothetical protein
MMQIVLITYINRSGSTFLANLLSSSKDVCVCPEGDAVVSLFLEAPGEKFSYSINGLQELNKSLESDPKMAIWNIQDDVKTWLEKAGTRLEAFFEILKYFRDRNKPDARTVIFKAERISALMEKIIHADKGNSDATIKFLSLVRDPRAVVASQMNTCYPGSTVPMSENPVWTAIGWRISQEQILGSGSGPGSQMILKYEDMISKPEETIWELSGFLKADLTGVSPGKGDLFPRLPGEIRHIHPLADKAALVDRIEGWKSRLTAEKIYLVEMTCRKYFDRFGYQKISKSFRPFLELAGFCQTLLFFTRRWYLAMLFYFNPGHSDAAL